MHIYIKRAGRILCRLSLKMDTKPFEPTPNDILSSMIDTGTYGKCKRDFVESTHQVQSNWQSLY
jgi:hypothetical protein